MYQSGREARTRLSEGSFSDGGKEWRGGTSGCQRTWGFEWRDISKGQFITKRLEGYVRRALKSHLKGPGAGSLERLGHTNGEARKETRGGGPR